MNDNKDKNEKIVSILESIDQLIETNDEINLQPILTLYDQVLALETVSEDFMAHHHFFAFVDETYVPYLKNQKPVDQREIARIYQKSAILEIKLERYDDAEKYQRLSTDLMSQFDGMTDVEQVAYARGIHLMAYLYSLTFRYGRAEILFEKTLSLFSGIKEKSEEHVLEDLARIHLDMAKMFDLDHRKKEALEHAERALSLYIEANTEDDGLLANLYEMIALAQNASNQSEASAESYGKLIELDRKRLDQGQNNAGKRLPQSYYGLAVTSLKLKRYDLAHQAIDQAISQYQSFEDPEGNLYQGVIAKSFVQKAKIDLDKEDFYPAIDAYEKAMALFVTLPEDSKKVFVSDLAIAHHDLGKCYLKIGRDDTALEHLEEADRQIGALIRIQTTQFVERYAENCALLAKLYGNKDQKDDARSIGQKAVAIYRDLALKGNEAHRDAYVQNVLLMTEMSEAAGEIKVALKLLDGALKTLYKITKIHDLKSSDHIITCLTKKVALLFLIGKDKKANKIKEAIDQESST